MTKVNMSTKLPVPARTVWDTIGGFNNVAQWHPAVAKSEESKDKDATVRTLSLRGGGGIVERLDAKDDKSRTYSYTILESPFPVASYKAVLHVEEGKDGGCTVEWSSEFQPSGAPESEVLKVVRGIYDAGFQNLQKMFGSK